MSATTDAVRGLIAEEAAEWFVANRAGLAARERERFAAWLRASPVHVEEYLGVAAVSADLREACATSADTLEAIISRARERDNVEGSPRWPRPIGRAGAKPVGQFRRVAVATGAIAAMVIALAAWWHPRTPAAVPAPQSFATAHGEQRSERLADGSVVHLNTDTAVTVQYSAAERLVTLTRGEAEFEVVHQAARAFRVFAGDAQVIAVGTRFDVRLQQESTVVTVAEGRVEVGPAALTVGLANIPAGGGARVFVQVGAEQQVRYSTQQWPATPQAADAGRTTSWLHRQITFEREPLERVASEFNRYSPKTIEIASPALRSLKISGAFATDDTDAFIAFLRSLDGVRVEVTATRIRVWQGTATPVH